MTCPFCSYFLDLDNLNEKTLFNVKCVINVLRRNKNIDSTTN